MSEMRLPHLTCTQCNGELHPDEGQVFVTCSYCGATVYLDKSQVVFHWSLAPTLDENQAAAALRRWMAGNQTVKDLDKKAQIISQSFQYFPLWYFKWQSDDSEEIALRPAAATSITEINRLNLPAGDLQRYDPALDSQAENPSVPLETAHQWLQQSHPGLEVRESALVHIPVYLFKYVYVGKTYTAVVEAATGSVLANLFPAKAEAPYLLAGGLTALVYLCLATLPLFRAASSGGVVSADSAGLALILGVAAAPFLFAFAVWVASRV